MSPNLREVKQFLTFSRSERNGIIVLLILVVALVFLPMFYRSFVNVVPNSDPLFYSKIDSFVAQLSLKHEEVVKTYANPIEREVTEAKKNINYFEFDPNTITVDELVMLGLTVKQTNVIDRFRGKGGKFFSDSDFAKVYVIDSSTFRRLQPWIKIDKSKLKKYPIAKYDSISKVELKPTIVELNSADTIELAKVKGIGRNFARRIIVYRNLLGGYVSVQQLKEVYGIKADLIASISSQLVVDSTKIKSINVNLVLYEDLKKHPYLTEFQSKAIIYYRSKVGTIKSINELLANKIISSEKYEYLKTYLTTK